MKRIGLWFTRAKIGVSGTLLVCLWFTLFSLVFRVAAVRAAAYQARLGPDVEAQLAFIRARLHEPEGVAFRQPNSVWGVFAHTLYGFSLVNTVLLDPHNETRRAEASHELEWLLERLNQPAATQGFVSTQVPYGVFYLGERNLTLAGLMLIDPDPDPDYEQQFHHNSHLLYEAFMNSPSAHLETWPGAAWPADNVPALYSLVIHDRLYNTNYGRAAARWVEVMAATADPATGLMASRIDYASGAALDLPRGCALSLTFAFLPDFAPDFARAQYAAYRRHFFKTTLGFAGIREYPPGRERPADIDSGPILLGVGAAATGIGLAATKAMGDTATFESIVQLSEIIGLPVQRSGQKAYLLGQLLIGDEFQVWGKTITPWSISTGRKATTFNQIGWPPQPISLRYFYSIAVAVGGILLWLSLLFVRGLSLR